MTLFFVINQDLFDRSAHALYCYRNCWWLAATAPVGWRVVLLFPGPSHWQREDVSSRAAAHFQFGDSSLSVTSLPAWRKEKHRRGFTLNAWFYHHAARHLAANALPDDIFITASFPKLLRHLAARTRLSGRLRWIYEVHQLACLDCGAASPKAAAEERALAFAQAFTTTTDALAALLAKSFPSHPCVNLGLACGGLTVSVPPPPPLSDGLSLGYIGSVYRGQGVDWLLEHWCRIRERLGGTARLIIAGGGTQEVAELQKTAAAHGAPDVEFSGKVLQADIPAFLARVNALIIPATPEGRMPYVAITKAYDYLSYGRPVVASAIQSVIEVMRPDRETLGFKPCDATALADALQRLLADPALAESLVDAAVAHAAELDWQTRAKKYWHWLFDAAK